VNFKTSSADARYIRKRITIFVREIWNGIFRDRLLGLMRRERGFVGF